jgi:hypothetical protein
MGDFAAVVGEERKGIMNKSLMYQFLQIECSNFEQRVELEPKNVSCQPDLGIR